MTRSLVLALVLLLPACSSIGAGARPAPPAAAAAPAAPPAAAERDGLRRDLEEARQELAIAELDAAHAVQKAARDLEQAAAGLEFAKLELRDFEKRAATDRREAELGVDRSRFRLEESRAELAELEAMYAEEEFAQTTKELVLKRGRRQVELAEAGLAIEVARLAERDAELQREQIEKRNALAAAEAAVTDAGHQGRRAELEAALEMDRARRQVEEFERKLADAERRS
jgi:hypothetical protein